MTKSYSATKSNSVSFPFETGMHRSLLNNWVVLTMNMPISIYLYVYVFLCVDVYMCVCVDLCMYIMFTVYIDIYIHTYIMYIYICMYVRTYVCTYVHNYTYLYADIQCRCVEAQFLVDSRPCVLKNQAMCASSSTHIMCIHVH